MSREERSIQSGLLFKSGFLMSKYFASGRRGSPSIDPVPMVVENDEEMAALFRVACLWWSIPVSRGFGRRFRVLVFDR
jgi:hypothetical protein